MNNNFIDSNTRYYKFDYLRGILSLLIIFHHMPNSWFSLYNLLIFKKQLFLSVDYFFLISGFFIYGLYENLNYTNILYFIKKRFLRLYPLFLFSSLLFSIILVSRYYLFNVSKNDQLFFYHYYDYFESFLDNLFLTSSTEIFGNLNFINTPSWTISADFFCYFIFSMQLGFKKNLRHFFSFFVFVSSIYLLFNHNTIFSTTTFGFARGYVGFFIGGLIFHYKSKFYFSNFNLLLFSIISGLMAILFSSILESNFFSSLFIYFFICISFFLVTKLNNVFPESNIINKIFIFLGSISYSIYLNHFIIILIMERLFGNIINHSLLIIITIFIIFLISYLTNIYIENKYRIFSKPKK